MLINIFFFDGHQNPRLTDHESSESIGALWDSKSTSDLEVVHPVTSMQYFRAIDTGLDKLPSGTDNKGKN